MVAWLCFIVSGVPGEERATAKELYDIAVANFKTRSHCQVLVYSVLDNSNLNARHTGLLRGLLWYSLVIYGHLQSQ